MAGVVETIINEIASTTTDVLLTNLPTLATIFAGLVALGIALHFVGRFIGRRA